ESVRRRWTLALYAMIGLSVPNLIIGYRDVIRLWEWRNWVPVRLHERGKQIAAKANHGRVLTLAPIIPLEGGAQIYPELATGPFAWRIAPFVNDASERSLNVIDGDTLEPILAPRLHAL